MEVDAMMKILSVADTPFMILLLWMYHKFSLRLTVIETMLQRVPNQRKGDKQ
jgi:hypothetical protein